MENFKNMLDYVHVDVFSPKPFSGNSLVVFPKTDVTLTTQQMLMITQELRHFEAIFVEPSPDPNVFEARVFDLFEELPFAGHPIIGAAAVLHRQKGTTNEERWTFKLPEKTVSIATRLTGAGYFGVLDQGLPIFLGQITERAAVAAAFGLSLSDLNLCLPVEVVSTGLGYVVVPVNDGVLHRAVIRNDITNFVRACGAQFAVLYDEVQKELRHWNNDGIMEDVATGSAAGVIGAYRLRHACVESGAQFTLYQGRFVGRPSELSVTAFGKPNAIERVLVGGDVAFVGTGQLQLPPLPQVEQAS
jgi:trans-2,3-dihydro-3-hydroxyanthranilate isomerase